MKYTLDRFEGDYAVVELESKEFTNVPRKALPPEAKEGDIILTVVDNRGTKEQRYKVEELMKTLWVD